MYMIAYDVGTTGLKSCLFELSKETGIRLIAGEMEDYDLYVLDNGGVEQDAEQWWAAMCRATGRLLKETGIPKEDVKGISFCAQMQALVLVDRDGAPVRRAMSYMDNRSAEQIQKGIQTGLKVAGMNAHKLLRSLKITGAVSGSVKDPVWKYRWVADNEPENFAKAYKWLDVKDFLVCRASGRFVMSRDSAFGTLLYDSRPGKDCFSGELCKMFHVDPAHLPEIVSSTQPVGGITERAAAELGLCEGTPVFSGGGDASLIGVGAGAVEVGDTHVYIGTSGWVSTVIDKQKLDVGSMIASIVGVQEGLFNCFAELETAGKCFEWAKDHIMMDDIDLFRQVRYADDIEEEKTSTYGYIMDKIGHIPAGSNGVIFTPWLHGNRCPFEDPNARGMFFGLGLENTAADMYHAVIEGVCFHLRWQMEAMDKLIKASDPVRLAGGGALSAQTCQILADVLGKEILVPEDPQDTGAVGAAALAAVGLGEIKTLAELKNIVHIERSYQPNRANTAVYDRLFLTFKELYKKNRNNYQAIAEY
ncbi:MAG: FGGY-family carbohydrate kinase [Firmicutes bacterium]|nr:FGGY-family carbohydrate kinase [Bacillota bacterium]